MHAARTTPGPAVVTSSSLLTPKERTTIPAHEIVRGVPEDRRQHLAPVSAFPTCFRPHLFQAPDAQCGAYGQARIWKSQDFPLRSP